MRGSHLTVVRCYSRAVAPALITMPDGARLRTWTTGRASSLPPVLLIHGGPGIGDYLGPVAECLDDTWLVHRYDQRGAGGSPWDGDHTLNRSVDDAICLLDHWGHPKVTVIGHSFGTNLASYLTLAHPDRVAGLVQIAGPFLGPRWRSAQDAAERSRRTPEQQARFVDLSGKPHLTVAEDIEFLTLAWFTNHADTTKAWQWASDAAQALRPVNQQMNRQLNAAKYATPLEDRLDQLRTAQPPHTTFIGGSADPRPEEELRSLAERLNVDLIMIPEAGHEPWLDQPEQFHHALRAAVAQQC